MTAVLRDEREVEQARLLEALQGMASAGEAEALLSQLASALFPGGATDLAQVTWDGREAEAPVRARDEREAAEAKLREAEARYRVLVEQIPAVTFMAALGEGRNEIYVSPHIEHLLGFTQEEWLENPFLWYQQLHPDDRPVWNEEFARGCRSGGPFRGECRFLARDGRVVWVRGEARLYRDERGRPLFLHGVAFDITEAKRAEALLVREAVRSTEQRYRDLVEGHDAIFWEADAATGRVAFVSRHAEQVLGFPREHWLDDPDLLLRLVHPDDRERVAAARAAAGAEQELEYRAVTRDGRLVWLHEKLRHLPGSEGRPGQLLGLIVDITGRKQGEDERASLLRREQEARAEAETLNRIGRSLAAELDVDRLVQDVSEASCALTGADVAAFFVRGREGQAYELRAMSGWPLPASAPARPDLFAPGVPETAAVRLRDVTADPHHVRHHAFAAVAGDAAVRGYLAVPVISRSGVVLGGLFFGHADAGWFSERHERLVLGLAAQAAVALDNALLYRAVDEARRAAEEANRAKDEFLATMSHELRTPLNAVFGWARMLRNVELDEATRRRALDTIERNARIQKQLIEDLLDVSRIVTGKLTLDVRSVDLLGIVVGALESTRLAADARGIELRSVLEVGGTRVSGDPARLQQVVWNLLSNAIKFTPPGGQVEIRLERSGSLARIAVADTGQGIEPGFLPHAFERFRQADSTSTRRHGGLGLGLAIVRHVVELHGGTVRADSAGPDRGATFTVEIPLAEPEGEVLPPAAGCGDVPSLAGVRILAVDDDPDALEVVTATLARVGAEVTPVASVAGALAALDRERVDVVVSDIAMPDEDGYSLVRAIRARSETAALPVIALTAYAHLEDRTRALRAGFHWHVPKPTDPTELVMVVAAALGRAAA